MITLRWRPPAAALKLLLKPSLLPPPDSGGSIIWRRAAAYLNAHLNALRQALADKGIELIYREVDDFAASVQDVVAVCASENVTHLFYNYQYELNERQRDAAVEKALPDVACRALMTA